MLVVNPNCDHLCSGWVGEGLTFLIYCNDLHVPNAEMTVPRVTRDLLMLAPSLSLSPVSPVASALSLQSQKKSHLHSTGKFEEIKEKKKFGIQLIIQRCWSPVAWVGLDKFCWQNKRFLE